MGDMAEAGKAMTQMRKDRHNVWHEANLKIIEASGIPYESANKGEALLFRGLNKADFYPSTGRWRSQNKTYRGGAKAFLKWWEQQEQGE
jgi:hypothetical protein